MKTQIDKKSESQAAANKITTHKNDSEVTSRFVDHRPEAIAQRKLQEMASNYNSQGRGYKQSVKQESPIQKKPNTANQIIQKMQVSRINLSQIAPKLGVPGNWKMTNTGIKRFGGRSIGIEVMHSWTNVGNGDFNLMEQVESEVEQGCFADLGTHRGGTIDGSQGKQADQHGAPPEIMSKEGYHVNKQLFIYWNRDTRAAVPNSGYKIIRRVLKISPTIFNFKIIVEGASVSVGDYNSKAGAGRFSAEFQIDFTSDANAPKVTDR
jgi:hypothetical protein